MQTVKKMKGDILYHFLQLSNEWTFFAEKYKNWKCILDFSDNAFFECFSDMLDRLLQTKAITLEENGILYSVTFLYFNAAIDWLDGTENTKIVIE